MILEDQKRKLLNNHHYYNQPPPPLPLPPPPPPQQTTYFPPIYNQNYSSYDQFHKHNPLFVGPPISTSNIIKNPQPQQPQPPPTQPIIKRHNQDNKTNHHHHHHRNHQNQPSSSRSRSRSPLNNNNNSNRHNSVNKLKEEIHPHSNNNNIYDKYRNDFITQNNLHQQHQQLLSKHNNLIPQQQQQQQQQQDIIYSSSLKSKELNNQQSEWPPIRSSSSNNNYASYLSPQIQNYLNNPQNELLKHQQILINNARLNEAYRLQLANEQPQSPLTRHIDNFESIHRNNSLNNNFPAFFESTISPPQFPLLSSSQYKNFNLSTPPVGVGPSSYTNSQQLNINKREQQQMDLINSAIIKKSSKLKPTNDMARNLSSPLPPLNYDILVNNNKKLLNNGNNEVIIIKDDFNNDVINDRFKQQQQQQHERIQLFNQKQLIMDAKSTHMRQNPNGSSSSTSGGGSGGNILK